MADYLATPPARIKVDETNCFGMVGWTAVGNSASGLPGHAAVAGLKYRAISFVEQEGVEPLRKDRGAEQGDVDGPERPGYVCGGSGSTAKRGRATFSRHIPWVVAQYETLKRSEKNRTKCSNYKTYSLTAQRNSQERRFVGFLVAANATLERGDIDTSVTFQIWTTLTQNGTSHIRTLATVAALHGNTTLGMAVGPRGCVADQQTSSEQCTSVFILAKICRPSSPSL